VVQETPESSWLPFHKAASVEVQINGKPVHIPLTTSQTSVNVDSYIHPGEMNSLLLLPDAKHPERKLKVWLELYPPQQILSKSAFKSTPKTTWKAASTQSTLPVKR